MNDTLNKFIIFAVGFAAGVVVTRMIIKRYEEHAYEEEYENEAVTTNADEPEDTAIDDGPTMKEYAAVLKNNKYIDYSTICDKEEVNNEPPSSVRIEDDDEYEPTIISPEELGELEGYDVVGLIYYADRVLTDEMNVPVNDAEKLIGYDALNHFGEYDDDSVCVRNDELKCDYEILLDDRRYSDVIKKPLPSQMEE